MIKRFEGLTIRGISAAVPKKVREMSGLETGSSPESLARLIKSTGIERSRMTDTATTASDLCESAARRLLDDLGLAPLDFDALVFVSPSPDYLSPPTSHILQFKLGLPKSAPCFDLAFGCSGYIYGLLQASMLITSRTAERVLLLVGETPTKSLRGDDLSTLLLFGDAGSATVVESSAERTIHLSAFSDGSGYRDIIYPNSACRFSTEPRFLSMRGAEVFEFAGREAPRAIAALLGEARVEPSDIDWFALHQANKLIVDFISKKLRLDPAKILWSLQNFGNTGAASIPLSMVVDSRFSDSPRKQVLMSGFGVGLSWGVALADLSDTLISRLIEIA